MNNQMSQSEILKTNQVGVQAFPKLTRQMESQTRLMEAHNAETQVMI